MLVPLALVDLVHLAEYLLLVLRDGNARISLLLERLAEHGVVRTAARRRLGGGRHDDDVLALFGGAVRRHEARRTGSDDNHIGFDGFSDIIPRNRLGWNLERPFALHGFRSNAFLPVSRHRCFSILLAGIAARRARPERGRSHSPHGSDASAFEEIPTIQFHVFSPFLMVSRSWFRPSAPVARGWGACRTCVQEDFPIGACARSSRTALYEKSGSRVSPATGLHSVFNLWPVLGDK